MARKRRNEVHGSANGHNLILLYCPLGDYMHLDPGPSRAWRWIVEVDGAYQGNYRTKREALDLLADCDSAPCPEPDDED